MNRNLEKIKFQNSKILFHLYGHPYCNLCDRLEALIRPHLEALRRRHPSAAVILTKCDIKTNTEWRKAYEQRIPVLTCNDRTLLEGRPRLEEVAEAFRRIGAA